MEKLSCYFYNKEVIDKEFEEAKNTLSPIFRITTILYYI